MTEWPMIVLAVFAVPTLTILSLTVIFCCAIIAADVLSGRR